MGTKYNPFARPEGTIALLQVPLQYALERPDNLRTYVRAVADSFHELGRLIVAADRHSPDIIPRQLRLIKNMTFPVGLSFISQPAHLLLHGGALALLHLLADRAAVFSRTRVDGGVRADGRAITLGA